MKTHNLGRVKVNYRLRDGHRNEWYSAEIQKTPEDLRNALLGTYANFLEDKITGNDRDLTVTETGEIQQRCRELLEKCWET